MADWRSYLTLQLLNVLTYLWFTAANVFAFSLSIRLEDSIGINPPGQPNYGYGFGKETFLTPAPWIYLVLFAVHVLFAGTVAFAQWTARGRDIVVGGLSFRWSLLMVLSIFWTGTWLRQWYILSWIFAIAVAAVAWNTTYIVRRRYRLEHELDWKDEVFVHLPFSLYLGWTNLLLAINTFAAFSPPSPGGGFPVKVLAVWVLAILSGLAHFQAFWTRSGDIPFTFVIAFGQLAIFAHQVKPSNTDARNVVAWFALAFAMVSVWSLAKSVWGTIQVVRHGSGMIRLDGDGEGRNGEA